jgi:PST family polysaccharide transporter
MQFGYAAVTARVISPAGFGAYGVSLAVYAILGLVAGMGLGNAAARRLTDDADGDRRLITLAIVTGSVGACVTFALAGPLGVLWGDPSATPLIQLVAIAVLVLPVVNVLGGILRRQGRIKEYAIGNLVATVTALLVGGAVVVLLREAWTLVLVPLMTQLVMMGWFTSREPGRARPTRRVRGTRSDLRFGLKSMVNSALTQFPYYVPMWALSRSAGPVVFGSWNRAVVVAQLPLESANRAAVMVIYPGFRNHAADPAGARRTWTDMLAATALVVMPLSGFVIPVLPAAVLVVLGDDWPLVAAMGMWLWAVAAVTVLRTLLATALESSDNYGKIWLSQVILAVAYLLSAGAVWATQDWVPLAVGLLTGALMTHAIQIYASRSLLYPGSLLRWYAVGVVVALVCAGMAAGVAGSGLTAVWQLLLVSVMVAGYLAAFWALRGRVGPIRRLLSAS